MPPTPAHRSPAASWPTETRRTVCNVVFVCQDCTHFCLPTVSIYKHFACHFTLVICCPNRNQFRRYTFVIKICPSGLTLHIIDILYIEYFQLPHEIDIATLIGIKLMVWKYFAIDAVHIFIVNSLRYFHVHILGGCVLQLYRIPDLSDGIVQDQPRANLPFVLQQ